MAALPPQSRAAWPSPPSRRGSGGVPQIDYLIIGHTTKDIVDGGFVLGGTVTYAGVAAHRLGQRVGIVTSAEPDLDFVASLSGVAVTSRPAAATTTFLNEYLATGRRQTVLAVAESLHPQDVPGPWQVTPVVHLGPLAHEFGAEMARFFRGIPQVRVLGATLQGWLRRWDASGHVSRQLLEEPEQLLPHLDAAVLSIEDVEDDWSVIEAYARLVPVLVATTGANGATVFAKRERREVPGFPTREVDATGAGDVFAAAYFIRLAAGDDPFEAARFANCAASFAVEGPQTTTIPTLAQVQARLAVGGRR